MNIGLLVSIYTPVRVVLVVNNVVLSLIPAVSTSTSLALLSVLLISQLSCGILWVFRNGGVFVCENIWGSVVNITLLLLAEDTGPWMDFLRTVSH